MRPCAAWFDCVSAQQSGHESANDSRPVTEVICRGEEIAEKMQAHVWTNFAKQHI